ncbi:MAG: hypothetical protein HY047_04695 [Acidobacteria bacterium]|nr:hypothetical protein [Acidobacteriota bacterium]
MKFLSTRGGAPPVPFTTALFDGLAPDGGLYVPETIEPWTASELARLHRRTLTEIALRTLRPFTRGEIDPATLEAVVVEALNFDARVPPRAAHARRHPVSGRSRESDAGSAADDVQRRADQRACVRRVGQLRRVSPVDARSVRRPDVANAHAPDLGELRERRAAAAAIGLLLSRRGSRPRAGRRRARHGGKRSARL